MAADGAAFWIDYDYDRENASDGVSRYGAYVRQSSTLAESWDGTWDDAQVRQARFAEAAWATATTPVMSPGFVRRHPRVIERDRPGQRVGRHPCRVRPAGHAVAARAGQLPRLAA